MLRPFEMHMSSMSDLRASLLIVDEDLGFASNAKQILESLGLNVSLSDPTDMDSIRNSAPDLMIIAAELPKSGSTGFSLCNRLRREDSLVDTRILITSDGSSKEALSHHVNIPERADAYANKPISDDQLRREVIALLSNEYIQSEEEDSVAFISDEEVLEIESEISATPPPLPEFDIEPWQAMNFDEMIRERCELESPTPPKQPNPETKMEYLRSRVRFLEEKDKATRSAWELIQEQGKDMERQAAASRFAAQRQYENLVETKKRLVEEIENYAKFNRKVSAVFEAKDIAEATLTAQLEQRNTELQRRQNVVAHLEGQVEAAKLQHATDEEKQKLLAKEHEIATQQYSEEKTRIKEQHQAAQQKASADNEELLAKNLAEAAQRHAEEKAKLEEQHQAAQQKANADSEELRRTKLAEAAQQHAEEKAKLEEQHQAAQQKANADHEALLMQIKLENEEASAKLKSDLSNDILLMETEHTGLILELSQEREEMLDELQSTARQVQEQSEQEQAQILREVKFIASEELRASTRNYKELSVISQTRAAQQDQEICLLKEAIEDKASQITMLRKVQESHKQSQSIQAIASVQLEQDLAGQALRLQDTEEKLQAISQNSEHKQAKIDELEIELSERYLELEEVQSEISMMEARQEERLEQFKSTEHKWRESQGLNAQQDAQIQTLSTRLSDSKEKLKQTEESLINAAEEAAKVGSLEQKISDLALNLDRQTQEKKQLQASCAKLKREIGENKETRRKLEAQTTANENELEKLQKVQASEKETWVAIESQISSKVQEIQDLQNAQEKGDEKIEQLRAQLATKNSEEKHLLTQINELQIQLDNRGAALEQSEIDNEQSLGSNAALTQKLGETEEILNALKAEYKKSATELEGEISDTQDSLYSQLEQVSSLRAALENLEGERTKLKAENTTVNARLNGAIKRIDELEGHLLESETSAREMKIELEDAILERDQNRAELALKTQELPDTEKPQKLEREESAPKVIVREKSEKLSRILKQAERAIERELDRRGAPEEQADASIALLPTRLEEGEHKTTTEADLPEEYFESLDKFRKRSNESDHDYLYLSTDDSAIMEIDGHYIHEEEDDTNVYLGEAGIQNTELESAMGIQEPNEEDTSPFGELMSSLGDVPAKNHFVRPHIEDPIAALQALEYSTGQIASSRKEDPFVHISELPWKTLNRDVTGQKVGESNEERRTTDVLHVDELD